jgi:Flp pilus assembly protein TadB
MINDLYSSLTSREQRALRWSATATAVALWLATAWADPWVLVTVPLIGAAYVVYAARSRRREDDVDDDSDWY